MFFAVMELFGNPINFIWTPLVRVEEWKYCRRLAKSLFKGRERECGDSEDIFVLDLATILSSIRELAHESGDCFDSDQTVNCQCLQPELHCLYSELAVARIDGRVHGAFRSLFSIILYILVLFRLSLRSWEDQTLHLERYWYRQCCCHGFCHP